MICEYRCIIVDIALVIGIIICIIDDIRAKYPLHVMEATTDTSDMIDPNFAALRDMEE